MNKETSTQFSGSGVRAEEAARFFGIGKSTFWVWVRTRPGFPQPIKLGPKVTIWDFDQLKLWRDQQINTPDSYTKDRAETLKRKEKSASKNEIEAAILMLLQNGYSVSKNSTAV